MNKTCLTNSKTKYNLSKNICKRHGKIKLYHYVYPSLTEGWEKNEWL